MYIMDKDDARIAQESIDQNTVTVTRGEYQNLHADSFKFKTLINILLDRSYLSPNGDELDFDSYTTRIAIKIVDQVKYNKHLDMLKDSSKNV